MNKHLKRILPVIAAISAVITLACGVVTVLQRDALLDSAGETSQVVEATLARLQSMQPASIDDPAFRQAVAAAQDEPLVAYAWLFSPDGRVLRGNLAVKADSTVEGMSTAETRRILASLPPNALQPEQRLSLLAASAMQAEGEHNDVFRHQLREVRSTDGRLVALVGLTFNVSPGLSAPGLTYQLSLLLGLAALAVYWLSLPLWVWLDARERGERAWVWAVFVLLGNLVALLAYLLARMPRREARPAAG